MYVSYYYEDDNDDTNYYNGYNFNFDPNGTCTAIKNGITNNGDWNLHDENSYPRFDLYYEGDVLYKVKKDWNQIKFTATTIRLKHESNGGNDNHYLNLSKN